MKNLKSTVLSRDVLERLLAESNEKIQQYDSRFLQLQHELSENTRTLNNLVRNPAIMSGNIEDALGMITKILADTFKVSMVGIWEYNEERDSIVSLDVYERESQTHSKGFELFASDYPAYFDAVKSEKIVDAADARQHPETKEFTESYFKPLDIYSLLDVPFFVGGKFGGVICFEQQHAIRQWRMEEILFTTSMCAVVSIVYQSLMLRQNEAELRRNHELLEIQRQEILAQNEELLQQQEKLLALNEALEQQKKRVESQNEELETILQQLQITSDRLNKGIRYAQSIQQTILPDDKDLKQYFSDYFALYLPKDFVSGDFYWFHQISEQKAVFVMADCTGHGVPGAFMSMIGNTILHKIIAVQQLDNPSEILIRLHNFIVVLLRQKEKRNMDGMDVCVAIIEKEPTLQEAKLTFAGAKANAYYVLNKELHTLEGNRYSIGGYSEREKKFENQVVRLPLGAMVYFASDGYADQNNPQRKSFGKIPFKQLLQEIYHLPCSSQHKQLLTNIKKYQDNAEQRDDITIVGIKL